MSQHREIPDAAQSSSANAYTGCGDGRVGRSSKRFNKNAASGAGPVGAMALPSPELPPGVGDELHFRRGSHELGFALNWARSPYDVYSYDADSGRLERWTASETGGLDAARFAVPKLVRYPTFDTAGRQGSARRTIPAFVYSPAADRFPGRRPVMISIHGGPEAQTRPRFLFELNYLVDELGVALIMPNVRGSSGYGKTYLTLDNAEKREDSVKDIGALYDLGPLNALLKTDGQAQVSS